LGDQYKIVIKLHPFDVHTQYYPMLGTVVDHQHHNSNIFNAIFVNKDDKTMYNEKTKHIISNRFGHIITEQIAGYLFRKIRYNNMKNQPVNAGDYLGKIDFGSQVDLTFPSKNCILACHQGQKVKGGHTILGSYMT